MATRQVIEVRNLSTVVADADVQKIMGCVQAQLSGGFMHVWQRSVHLVWKAKTVAQAAGTWRLDVLDDSDQAGALGYHDDVQDTISASIFAATDLKYGYSLPVTFSHEALEMAVDPLAILGAQSTDRRWYALEVGDPVEADDLGYKINHDGYTCQVSDWITPDWFDPDGKGPFDWKGHLDRPLQLAEGGYYSYWENGQWSSDQMQQGEIVPKPIDWTEARFARLKHRQSRQGGSR